MGVVGKLVSVVIVLHGGKLVSVVGKLVSVIIVLQVFRVGKLLSLVGKLVSVVVVLQGGQIVGRSWQID